MSPVVLVVNVGSSSIKLRVVHDGETVAGADLPGDASDEAVDDALEDLPDVDVAAHRIVHGGARFVAATRLDAAVLDALDELSVLAPLHNPPAVLQARHLLARRPDLPAFACFDTAFHADLPPAAATYALPAAWRDRWGLRRYGFHGLSHAHAARRAAAMVGRTPEDLRVVTCHLGAGSSLAAVAGGRSVDTTMGFTPLEGLVMATRSGSVDPGLVLWLQDQEGMDAAVVADGLEHRSGLLGLSNRSADVREVLAAAELGDADAHLALAVQAHRLRAGIAAMAAATAGLDALVFTGGVGEHQPAVRRSAVEGLGFLGIGIDQAANRAAAGATDADVTGPGAEVRVLVVVAREELEMARQVEQAIARRSSPDR